MQAGSLNFNFVKKLVKVVTFMCARGPAPHVERGQKTLQLHGFLYKHMGKLQRTITLILRRESKICLVKSLVSTRSACPYKNYPPKCSQIPHELDYLFKFAFFFYLGQAKLIIRPLQYDSLFPLSSESLGHAGGRFIIHYSLSLYVLERQQH